MIISNCMSVVNVILYFISSISWQLVAIVGIIVLYKKIGSIKSLFIRHNNSELVVMTGSGEEKLPNVVNQLGINQMNASKQNLEPRIQAQDSNNVFKWRKYSNGFLVVQYKIKLSQYINIESQTIYYPLSMSNEVISVQLISPLNLKIIELGKICCKIKPLSYLTEEELEQFVEIIICGF